LFVVVVVVVVVVIGRQFKKKMSSELLDYLENQSSHERMARQTMPLRRRQDTSKGQRGHYDFPDIAQCMLKDCGDPRHAKVQPFVSFFSGHVGKCHYKHVQKVSL
jgi:hypothetical protein